jgi:hypothetical protein
MQLMSVVFVRYIANLKLEIQSEATVGRPGNIHVWYAFAL